MASLLFAQAGGLEAGRVFPHAPALLFYGDLVNISIASAHRLRVRMKKGPEKISGPVILPAPPRAARGTQVTMRNAISAAAASTPAKTASSCRLSF